MILLLDIGNTNTHIGLADARHVLKQTAIPTARWLEGTPRNALLRFAGRARLEGAALCSVVPRITPFVQHGIKRLWHLPCLELTARTLCGVGIKYPRPETIGPDRLANAVAVRHHYGAPAIVVDFGTAVTLSLIHI